MRLFFLLTWMAFSLYGYTQSKSAVGLPELLEELADSAQQKAFSAIVDLSQSMSTQLTQQEERDTLVYQLFYQRAKAYQGLGSYQAANVEWGLALQYLPKGHPEKWVYTKSQIGDNHQRLQQLEASLANYEQAISTGKEKLSPSHRLVINAIKSQAIAYIRQGDKGKGEQTLRNALGLLQKSEKKDTVILGDLYLNIGGLNIERKNLDTAYAFLLKAKENYEQVLDPLAAKMGSVMVNLANCQDSRGYLWEAIDYYRQTEKIWQYNYGPDHPRMGVLYLNWGLAMHTLGDFEKALLYQQKALDISTSKLGKAHFTTISCHKNMALAYESLEQYELAQNHFSSAQLQLQIKYPPTDPKRLNIQLRLAALAKKSGQYAQAITTYQALIPLLLRNSNYYDQGVAYSQLGHTFSKVNDWDQAVAHYQKAVAIFDLMKGNGEYEKINTLLLLSEAYEELGQGREADETFAYIQQLMDRRQSKATVGQEQKVFLGDKNILSFHQLRGKRALQYYLESGEIQSLKQAQEYFGIARSHYYSWRQFLEEENTKVSSAETAADIIVNSIYTNDLLYQNTDDIAYLEEAFLFAERARNQLLQEKIRQFRALAKSNIPESVIAEEIRLKQSIQSLQAEVDALYANFDQANQSELNDLQTALFDKKKALLQYFEKLQKAYPDYHQLLFTNPNLSAQEIRQQLPIEQALIAYTLNDSLLFTFVLHRDHIQLYTQIISPSFTSDITNLHQQLSTPNSNFENLAYQNAQVLLGAVLSDLPSSVKHLTIIPDGVISYLPFEALLSRPVDKTVPIHQYPFLLRDYQISYAYTANLLFWEGEKQAAKKEILCFAPSYELPTYPAQNSRSHDPLDQLLRSGHLPLPGAQKEVESIASIFPTTAFIGSAASEAQFKKEAGSYPILHLSMHALADEQNPLYSQLLFTPQADSIEDGILTVAEIYNLRLQARMAVLSACNTGYGQLQKGEGVMSLSRAFAHAGVPTTLMSLWKVPDDSTTDLMVDFYQNLQQKASKRTALHRSKLALIDQAIHPAQAHPFYWSGFVLVGNSAAIFTDQTPYWPMAIGSCLLLFLLFWFRKNK